MSRAYKCDRCGAFYSSNTKVDKITTRRYDNSNAMREFDDLCEECTRQLKEWFNLATTIEPEARTGNWITIDHKTAKCSSCGWLQHAVSFELPNDIEKFTKCYQYCTSCGVKMEGGEKNVLDK